MTWQRAGVLGALAVVVGLGACAAWPKRPPAPPRPAGYDLTAAPTDAIAPGTPIEPGDHPGWSRLVLKSRPRIRPDQRGKVNDLTARMAGWMVTAFLADVVPGTAPGGPRHRLRSVGLGFATAVNGKDVTVTPDTAAKLGADVGWVGRAVLSAGYERQKTSAVVVRSDGFWLVDTPVWFADGGTHSLNRFRYALLVDGPTGRLDVVVWRITPDGKPGGDPPAASVLDPEGVDVANLLVDAGQINLVGVPSEAAFAVDGLPVCGKPVGLPPAVRPLAAQDRFTPAEAAALETGLRTLTAPR